MQLSNWAQLLNYDVLRRTVQQGVAGALFAGGVAKARCFALPSSSVRCVWEIAPPPTQISSQSFPRHQTLLFPSALRHRRRSDGPVGCSAMRRCGCSHCFVLGPIHICCFMSSTCIFGIFMCTFIFLVTVRLFAGVGA
jgi:hypothetical protein